jgi:hypothetical protein
MAGLSFRSGSRWGTGSGAYAAMLKKVHRAEIVVGWAVSV